MYSTKFRKIRNIMHVPGDLCVTKGSHPPLKSAARTPMTRMLARIAGNQMPKDGFSIREGTP
jgi:hypothetical protein